MYQKLSTVLLVGIFGLLAVHYSAGSPPAGTIPPAIVARLALQNQTTPTASTPIYTPTETGLYRISVYMTEPQNSTGNVWNLNLQWTDEVGVETTNYIFMQQGGYGPPLAYGNNINAFYAQPLGMGVLQAMAGQPISYNVTATQSSNGGAYSIYFVVERL
jgi:hypothetical protein